MKGAWKAALVVAAIAVLIDYVMHYFVLPEFVGGVQVDFHESAAYFVAKLAVFAGIAWLLLASKWMQRMGGPILYGLVASASFGALYYVAPGISIGTGSMPLPLKGVWGGIHAGCGTVAAGVYTRNPIAVIWGVFELAASAFILVTYGALLGSIPPGSCPYGVC